MYINVSAEITSEVNLPITCTPHAPVYINGSPWNAPKRLYLFIYLFCERELKSVFQYHTVCPEAAQVSRGNKNQWSFTTPNVVALHMSWITLLSLFSPEVIFICADLDYFLFWDSVGLIA